MIKGAAPNRDKTNQPLKRATLRDGHHLHSDGAGHHLFGHGDGLNRPGFTGGQNSRRIAHYGTHTKEEDLEAVFRSVAEQEASVDKESPTTLVGETATLEVSEPHLPRRVLCVS